MLAIFGRCTANAHLKKSYQVPGYILISSLMIFLKYVFKESIHSQKVDEQLNPHLSKNEGSSSNMARFCSQSKVILSFPLLLFFMLQQHFY